MRFGAITILFVGGCVAGLGYPCLSWIAHFSSLLWVLTFCRVELAPGVDYVRTADVKDQIELSGNDIQAVSMTGEFFVSFLKLLTQKY